MKKACLKMVCHHLNCNVENCVDLELQWVNNALLVVRNERCCRAAVAVGGVEGVRRKREGVVL